MRLVRTLVAFAIGSVASAQTVWSMGAPWTDLAAVVAAAAPGDIVMLNGMTFPPVAMSKGLTLLGPGVLAGALGSSLTSLTIPPGERAHVVDVDFQPFVHPALGLFGGHKVVADGQVTFEDCTFGQGVPNNLVTSGVVILHRCTVTGDSAAFFGQVVGGMVVQSGYCSLVDCTIRGANAVFCGGCAGYWIAGSVALRVIGGTVVASNTSFHGGSGGTGGIFVPSHGVSAVQTAGVAYFTDCILVAGANPAGSPLPALVGNATTYYARTTFGTMTGQSNVPQLVGMQLSQGLRIGQTSTITAVAGNGNLLGILAGLDGAVGTHPVVSGLVLAPLGDLVTLAVATPPAGGTVSHGLAVPNASTLVGFAVFVQAFQLDGGIVRASAAIGSVVR